MGGNDLMDKFTFHPLPKNMLCNILLTKFFPDPVQPLKESAKAFLDCKTVRIFAYARFARVRLVRHALPISLLILRKKPTVLQSKAFLGDLLFKCPTIALSTVSVTKCCPNTRRRRAGCRPVMLAAIHLPLQHSEQIEQPRQEFRRQPRGNLR